MSFDSDPTAAVNILRDKLVLLATERAKLRANLESFFTMAEQMHARHNNFEILMQEFTLAVSEVEDLENTSRIYAENYGRTPPARGKKFDSAFAKGSRKVKRD